MASILLRAARTGARQRWAVSSLLARRYIHSSLPVYKKKQKVVIDDLFSDDEGNSGDLFNSDTPATPSTSASTVFSKAPASTSVTAQKKKHSSEDRLKHYTKLLQYVSDRIGKHRPAGKFPEQVRNSAWIKLFGLAKTPEQMQQLVEMFPQWIEGGRKFSPKVAEAFIRRCEELHCPLLALSVFSDYQKYCMGFPVSSKRAIYQFLHSLQQEHPVSKVVQAAALFGPYKLPPITSDLVSCAMLTSACLRDARRHQLELEKEAAAAAEGSSKSVEHKAPPSLVVALTLVPALQRLVSKAEPLPVPTGGMEKDRAKERVWLKWALARIEHYLPRLTTTKSFQGVKPVSVEWLTQWRAKSGYLEEERESTEAPAGA